MRRPILALLILLAAPFSACAQLSGQGDLRAGLSRLHDELHLSAAQEPAWRDYQAAITPDPQAQARRRSAQEMLPNLPTPRRIALMEASMTSDLTEFRRQGQAVIAFYDQLTPDQQKTFDRVTVPAPRGIAD